VDSKFRLEHPEQSALYLVLSGEPSQSFIVFVIFLFLALIGDFLKADIDVHVDNALTEIIANTFLFAVCSPNAGVIYYILKYFVSLCYEVIDVVNELFLCVESSDDSISV